MLGRQVEKLAGRDGGEREIESINRACLCKIFSELVVLRVRPPPPWARGLSQADSQAEGKHGVIGYVRLPLVATYSSIRCLQQMHLFSSIVFSNLPT